MDNYNYITISTYLFLSFSWAFIFLFALQKFFLKEYSQKYFKILILIIAIVAIKSFFESVYFGLYFGSLYGFLPKYIYTFLSKPEFLILPKSFNAISAIIILIYIYKGYLSEHIKIVESKLDELEVSHIQNEFLKSNNIKQNDLIELFEIVSEIKHYVLKASSREDILNFTCKKLSQYSHYKVVWIGIEQESSSKIFVDYYEDKSNPPYLDSQFYVSSNPEDISAHGPVGKAFNERITQIVEDTQKDISFAPWKERAYKSKIKSVIAIPMFASSSEKTQGTVTIYISDEHQYSFEEVKILEEIVQHISLASSLLESEFSKNEKQNELKETKNLLKNNEKRFRKLLDEIPNIAIQGYDKNHVVTYWNKQSERLYGYSYEEVKGKTVEELIIPYGMVTYVRESINNWIEKGIPLSTEELQLKKKNGELINVFSSHVLLNELSDSPELFCMDIDLTKQIEAQDKLDHLANYDALTQLPNRHYMLKHLHATINKAERFDESFALMFLDLDGFKAINDTYGHQYGDEVLSITARRLESILREYDFLSRFGGDEFLLTIEYQKNRQQIEVIADKIIDIIEEDIIIDNKLIKIGVSIGISCYPDHSYENDSLISMADASMYEAKKIPKSNYKFFSTCNVSL